MASHFSIPRFLLPQSGPVWRRANLGNRLRNPEALLVVRYFASSNAAKASKPGKAKQQQPPQQQQQKQKIIVLEKPEKFNPPSHGARLPSKNRPPQKHYGGPVSGDEAAAQRKKDYPGLPPPQGTWSHWFWHSRVLHMSITMGTLGSLAIYTAIENFKANTPFRDMLPAASDFWKHPILSIRTSHEIWTLTALHQSRVTAEKRQAKVDDVAKRSEYRKAHGLDKKGGLTSWTAKDDSQSPPPPEPGQKREKWFGIF